MGFTTARLYKRILVLLLRKENNPLTKPWSPKRCSGEQLVSIRLGCRTVPQASGAAAASSSLHRPPAGNTRGVHRNEVTGRTFTDKPRCSDLNGLSPPPGIHRGAALPQDPRLSQRLLGTTCSGLQGLQKQDVNRSIKGNWEIRASCQGAYICSGGIRTSPEKKK